VVALVGCVGSDSARSLENSASVWCCNIVSLRRFERVLSHEI
jgi:hypothetical protein